MSDDDNEQSSPGWLRQIGMNLAGPPRDRHELVDVFEEARDNELLDADALWMLKGVLRVSELQVRDIMVPRSQMAIIESNADAAEIHSIATQTGHSRFPVIGGSRDEVAGILLAKDMLGQAEMAQTELRPFDVTSLLRPAVFVPESKRANVLLKELKSSRNHMAVVVDEYGGVSGLVTIEDALEQIVGDIDDEHDQSEGANILRQEKNRYQLRGLTPIDEFNRYFGAEFADDDFDTVGGLIIHAFGHMPRRGESVHIDRFQFNVQKADSRRIHWFQVSMMPADNERDG